MIVPLVDLSAQHRQVADAVRAGLDAVMRRTDFVLGSEVRDFEQAYGDFSGVRHCIGVANGTDAIELALRAAGIGAGDEVIVPANSFVASAGAVARLGARPVFADCDETYLLLDPHQVAQHVTERTRAILPVHLYGQMAPMAALQRVADTHDLILIEDAAQAQGGAQDGIPAGGAGLAGGTSFYPGKNLGAYGEAGAVLTDSAEIAESVQLLRNHGSTVKYLHDELGFNSRLDTMQAVVLLAKLQYLATWNDGRRAAAQRYEVLLRDIPHVQVPRTMPGNLHVWHLYVIRVPMRGDVLARLDGAGIGASIHYPVPIHLQGAFRQLGHVAGDFPVAECAAREILSLPLYPHITAHQQERVVEALAEALLPVD